jgi:hypothetical protein
MANSVTTQILNDGPRNVTVKVSGFLDTSDVTSTVIVDPALLSDISINGQKATKLRIDRIVYDVEDLLDVTLFFDATTPVRAWDCVGRGELRLNKSGGIQNNAGAGVNGKITLTTQGWVASAVLQFSIVLSLVKQ